MRASSYASERNRARTIAHRNGNGRNTVRQRRWGATAVSRHCVPIARCNAPGRAAPTIDPARTRRKRDCISFRRPGTDSLRSFPTPAWPRRSRLPGEVCLSRQRSRLLSVHGRDHRRTPCHLPHAPTNRVRPRVWIATSACRRFATCPRVGRSSGCAWAGGTSAATPRSAAPLGSSSPSPGTSCCSSPSRDPICSPSPSPASCWSRRCWRRACTRSAGGRTRG